MKPRSPGWRAVKSLPWRRKARANPSRLWKVQIRSVPLRHSSASESVAGRDRWSLRCAPEKLFVDQSRGMEKRSFLRSCRQCRQQDFRTQISNLFRHAFTIRCRGFLIGSNWKCARNRPPWSKTSDSVRLSQTQPPERGPSEACGYNYDRTAHGNSAENAPAPN